MLTTEVCEKSAVLLLLLLLLFLLLLLLLPGVLLVVLLLRDPLHFFSWCLSCSVETFPGSPCSLYPSYFWQNPKELVDMCLTVMIALQVRDRGSELEFVEVLT